MADKLQLLVLNDEPHEIATDLIDVITVPNGPDDDSTRIATWPQHLHLWGHGLIPQFDLLLIDIKWKEDLFDPVYFGEERGLASPYGLLHALPLVAQQRLTRLPIAWGIHSAGANMVKDDPVAIWAFGMLCAMEQRERWGSDWDWGTLRDRYSEALDTLPAQTASDAWQELVRRYRDRLLDECGRRYSITISRAFRDLKIANGKKPVSRWSLTETQLKGLSNATAGIEAGKEGRSIALRSLFADYDWDAGNVKKHVLPFLTKIESLQAERDLGPQVTNVINEGAKRQAAVIGSGSTSGTGRKHAALNQVIIETESDPAERARLGIGVLICTWLKLYADTKAFPTLVRVETSMGTNDGHNLRRWLAYVGIRQSPGQFIESLKSEEVDSRWLQLAIDYWKSLKKNGKVAAKIPEPKCLGF